MMGGHKQKTAPALKLLQVRLPKDLVIAFRTLALTKETTARTLLEELIRERLKQEGYEQKQSALGLGPR